MSSYSGPQFRYASSPGSARITWAVQRLILLNGGIFALQLLADPFLAWLDVSGEWSRAPGGILNYYLGFQPVALLQGMVWKPFTYQFLHSGLLHLFLNMLWLFFCGPEVERALGTRQFYRFYLLCGAVGVLATFLPLLWWGDNPTVTGASGATMGVMIAFAMVDPNRQFFLFPIPTPVNARMLVLIVVVMNLLSGMGNSSVSVATHFGGMGVGYAYMKLMPKFRQWNRERRVAKAPKAPKPAGDESVDKVGEAVNNIFKFKDKDWR
jgi:membrane associated rhomboid family serine protease